MKLVFGKFDGGVLRIDDAETKRLVAQVFGHTAEEELSGKPNAMARLFVGAPGLLESLQAVVDQAEAQFKAGDRYATFSKAQIAQFKEDLERATKT